jgi:hypothetical protein
MRRMCLTGGDDASKVVRPSTGGARIPGRDLEPVCRSRRVRLPLHGCGQKKKRGTLHAASATMASETKSKQLLGGLGPATTSTPRSPRSGSGSRAAGGSGDPGVAGICTVAARASSLSRQAKSVGTVTRSSRQQLLKYSLAVWLGGPSGVDSGSGSTARRASLGLPSTRMAETVGVGGVCYGAGGGYRDGKTIVGSG